MITSPILACATCASNFMYGETDAAGWAIALMLMIIIPLIMGVLYAMIRIAKREKAGLDPRYSDDYLPPVSNS